MFSGPADHPVASSLPAPQVCLEIHPGFCPPRTIANLQALQQGLDGSAGSVLNVEGGWYGIVRVPATQSEEEWTLRLLREQDVLVQPGFYFDFETEAFLVLSLLTPPETFQEGLRRLRAFL